MKQLCGILTLCMAPWVTHAATIDYVVGSLGGSKYETSYTVSNDGVGTPLQEFTIFFDPALYASLAVSASPAGWDSLVVQPDTGLPDDGFFDALALYGGLAVDGLQGGFAVQFTWLGAGTPGAQPFEIVDPDTFQTLESGSTTVVPLPATGWLLAWSTALVAYRARSRARRDGAPS